MQENGGQPVDLLGDLGQAFSSNEYSNGIDKRVSFDNESGIGLPNPTFFDQGQGQFESEGQKMDLHQRNMSEGEILGYQNEYGGSVITGQSEYLDDDGDVDNGTDIDHVGQGQYNDQFSDGHQVVPHDDMIDNYSNQNVDPSQNFYEENVENDYIEPEEVQGQESGYPEEYGDDNADPDNWQPEMDPERSRRSMCPERSMTPAEHEVEHEDEQYGAESDGNLSWKPEMDPERSRRSGSPERSMSPQQYAESQDDTDSSPWQPQMDSERSRRSGSPVRSISPSATGQSESVGEVDSDIVSSPSEAFGAGAISEPLSTIPVESQEPRSQGSLPMSSETESLDSRSETEGTPKKSRMKIPKPRLKKPLDLPPWDDNVVIPPPPRMKPTMIGKQADLPPPAPSSPRRPKTAPARHSAKG